MEQATNDMMVQAVDTLFTLLSNREFRRVLRDQHIEIDFEEVSRVDRLSDMPGLIGGYSWPSHDATPGTSKQEAGEIT